MTDLINIPVLQVVFPSNFPVAQHAGTQSPPIPLTEILEEGTDIVNVSDPEILRRAALYFDMPEAHFSNLQVTRPGTGSIVVSTKFEYGDSAPFFTVRTQQEVGNLWDSIDTIGPSKYPGMTYEQGIEAVLTWLTDEMVNADEIYSTSK
jgi:hypothetical protein